MAAAPASRSASASPSPAAARSPSASPTPSPSLSPASSFKEDELCAFEDVEEIKSKYAQYLSSLRSLLTLPCPDDIVCYRFLRGHKFDVAVASKELQHTLEWRKQHGLDELRKKAEKMEQKQFPNAEKVLAVHPHNISHGVDRKGQPLSVERLGHANPYLMVRSVAFDEMLSYHFYHMESKAALVSRMTAEQGRVIRTAKIMDLSGLGRHHLDRKGLVYFKKLVDLSQHAYPEMLGDLYIVNTPWIFSMCWKLVSPWLNEKTLSKIHILPNDRYQQMLREAIPPEHIPDFLGGECTCDGKGCVPLRDPNEGLTTVQVAGRGKYEHVIKIDAAEFERLKTEALAAEADEAAAAAAAATPAAVSLEAAASSIEAARTAAPSPEGLPGSEGVVGVGTFRGVIVRYCFRTVKNDVGMEIRIRDMAGPIYSIGADAHGCGSGVRSEVDANGQARASVASPEPMPLQEESDSFVVLKALKRYASDTEPVSGAFFLPAPSEVRITFDNTFSVFTGKTVLYRVEVDAAVEHPQDEDENRLKDVLCGALKEESAKEGVALFTASGPAAEACS